MTILEILDSKGLVYKQQASGWALTTCFWCKKEKLYIHEVHAGFVCFSAACGKKGGSIFLLEKLDIAPDFPLEVERVEKDAYVEPPALDSAYITELHTLLLSSEEHITYLKKKRGLTVDTIKKFKIGLHGQDIVIPIYNSTGDCINFKVRSNPLDGSPKRMWGLFGRGKPVLFNASVLKKKNDRVIICEGEFDCMLLAQYGYSSVSSTGGCMAFQNEWIPLFERAEKIYLCFDNDLHEQGQKAAVKTAKQFFEQEIKPWIITIPNPLSSNQEKIDVTDFFVTLKREKKDFTNLLLNAEQYIGANKQAEFSFISWDELATIDFPPDQWIVKSFIPIEGITCVAGLPGSMKSYFISHLITCVLQGKPLLDRFETQSVPILIIDKENRLSRLQQRFKLLGLPKEITQKLYFMKGDFLFEDKASMAAVENMIIRHDIKLVVLDTLVRMHQGEENSASDTNKIFQGIHRMNTAGAAVVGIHHFNKRGSGVGQTTDVRELLRGSGDILAQLDTYFALQIVENQFLQLTFGKSRDEQMPNPMLIEAIFDEDATYFTYLKDVDTENIQSIAYEDVIYEFICANNPTRKQIQDRFSASCSQSTIDRTVKKLRLLGKVTSLTNGTKEVIYLSV